MWRRPALIGLCVLGALVLGAEACVAHLVAMPGRSFQGAVGAADAQRLAIVSGERRTIEHLATELGERNVGRDPAKLAAAASWIRGELEGMGYTVESQRWDEHGVGVENLSAERRGLTAPQELVVIGAHYDSAPGTPGADDNASGVAAALWLAREWATKTPARTVRFVFFTNEEPPWFGSAHMGSAHAAARSLERHETITAMLSLETMAFASSAPHTQHSPFPLSTVVPDSGDFITFVATADSRPLAEQCVKAFREVAQVGSEGLAAPAAIQGVDWSDHGPYGRAGFPALMVTDTAPFRNPNYHETSDLPASLDYDFLARVTVGLVRVLEVLGG